MQIINYCPDTYTLDPPISLPSSSREGEEVCFTDVGLCVCLSACLYVILKRLRADLYQILWEDSSGKGRPSSCFVTIGRGMWK